MFSPARITALRKSKGYSQELLAERSGVSLRTIQRVEQSETMPRGHTLQALARALDLPLEALREEPAPEPTAAMTALLPLAPQLPALPAKPAPRPTLRPDPQYLELLNLSALSFLVLPFLNLVVPLLLWRKRRHDTEHVAEIGRRVLGFQVLWQVGCFFGYLLLALAQMAAARYFGVKLPGLFLGLFVLSYAVNVATVGYYARQLRRGRLDIYRFRL